MLSWLNDKKTSYGIRDKILKRIFKTLYFLIEKAERMCLIN